VPESAEGKGESIRSTVQSKLQRDGSPIMLGEKGKNKETGTALGYSAGGVLRAISGLI